MIDLLQRLVAHIDAMREDPTMTAETNDAGGILFGDILDDDLEDAREAIANPQPDASALVEAIVEAALDAANVVSHDGYYEIDRDAAVRAALTAWEAQHG